MRKLSLANLAQNELQKNEANKVKGGLCTCYCAECTCPPEYRVEYRIADKVDGRVFVSAG